MFLSRAECFVKVESKAAPKAKVRFEEENNGSEKQLDFSKIESAPNIEMGDSPSDEKAAKEANFVWKRPLKPFRIYPDIKRVWEFSDEYKGDVEVKLFTKWPKMAFKWLI